MQNLSHKAAEFAGDDPSLAANIGTIGCIVAALAELRKKPATMGGKIYLRHGLRLGGKHHARHRRAIRATPR